MCSYFGWRKPKYFFPKLYPTKYKVTYERECVYMYVRVCACKHAHAHTPVGIIS